MLVRGGAQAEVTNRLAAVRQARGWSQGRLIHELVRRAQAAGIAIAEAHSLKVYVSQWENGRRLVGEPYRTLLRGIFGLTDEELFGKSGLTRPNDEHQELIQRLALGRAGDCQVAQLLARHTDFLRNLDKQVGAPTLIDQMAGHLASLERVLTYTILPSAREPIAAVLADAAALAAWQALDVGAVDRAWQQHEVARRAALEARQPSLLAHALGQQAFVLLEVGETSAAVDLVREAQQVATRNVPRRLSAWLYAAEAEVCAAAGDQMGCRRALDRATALLPAGPAAIDPEMPYIVLNDTHLARWRGHSLARLGDADALDDLYKALNGMDGTFTRAEAALRCDLAYAHLMRGEQGEAKNHAREARVLASRSGSIRQLRRLDRIVAA
jgi:transcriptional regulator with XRE-family HTH domain